MRRYTHGWNTQQRPAKSAVRFSLLFLVCVSSLSSSMLVHAQAAAAGSKNGTVPIEFNFRAGTAGDSDGDSIPDISDVDDDNDTIPDDIEGTADADGDGIANCLDLDSDNDGIPDFLEVITNAGLLRLLDANSDGALDASVAVGNNGLADVIEDFVESGTTQSGRGDLDGDGIPDHQDLDVDNDGIPDVIEAGSSDTNQDGRYDFFLDLNSDGFADRLSSSPITPRDTDRDGVPDFRDADSDQDGLSDTLETVGVDTDSDGRIDMFVDINVDGLVDTYSVGPNGYPDTDQDGFPDYRDTDSDGDGVTDAEEAFDNPVASGPVIPTEPFNPGLNQSAQTNDVALETGENGSVFGCALAVSANTKLRGSDPMFVLLFLVAIAVLLHRSTALPASLLVLVGLLSACSTSPRITSTQTNTATFTPYAGIGLGASFLNANTTGLPLTQDESISAAGQVTLGASIGQRFAVEARVADLGEATFTNNQSVGYQVADLSALYQQRFGKLSGFGRIGAGALFNDGDIPTTQKNQTHLLVGVGVDYSITSRLGLRAEWQGHDTDVMHGQFSVLYRFGAPARARPIVFAKTDAEFLPVPAKRNDSLPSAETRPITDDQSSLAGLEIEKIPKEQLAMVKPIEPTITPEVTPSSSAEAARLKPLITIPAEKKIVVAPVDLDKDGVVDASDECPDTVVETPVLANGCQFFGEAIPGLSFIPETDQLTASAESILDTVAGALNDESDIRVTVSAHTASTSDSKAAMFLTRRRTIAIIRYLSDKGIDATRLRPEAFGDTQPLAGATELSENDRVVLSLR